MSGYPRPIHDWTNPDSYPSKDDATPNEWAWEFLRRNGDYQRLWTLFAALPDTVAFTDEQGEYNTDKCGKWRGTPWQDFRFFEGDAGWYADPPPIPGEHVGEYDARCPGGEIIPFAAYIRHKFRCWPPEDPSGDRVPDISGAYDEVGLPPWEMVLDRPREESWDGATEGFSRQLAAWHDYVDGIDDDPGKVAIVFDLRFPIPMQIDAARAMLERHAEYLFRDVGKDAGTAQPDPQGEMMTKELFPQYRPGSYVRALRLLDADASGATLEEMAEGLYPQEDNSHDTGYRVSKKLRAALKAARRLRDHDWWLIAER